MITLGSVLKVNLSIYAQIRLVHTEYIILPQKARW